MPGYGCDRGVEITGDRGDWLTFQVMSDDGLVLQKRQLGQGLCYLNRHFFLHHAVDHGLVGKRHRTKTPGRVIQHPFKRTLQRDISAFAKKPALVVNDRVNLPRKTRRRLRAIEHRLRTTGSATLTENQLAGWQSLQKMIDIQRDHE